MLNLILILASFLVCIIVVVDSIRKKKIWNEDETLYSNLFGLRAFIMAIVMGGLLIVMLLNG
jgi:hypothetical protein